MKLTKKQRDTQERELAQTLDAIDAQYEQECNDADDAAEDAQAWCRRTHNGMFQDSYSDHS